ncbi:MAG TPA: MMPL family transporter [Streptosporangiaceae bacterium]|nr:MMPL family transporter [Streptosporangiaceae bacterium]
MERLTTFLLARRRRVLAAWVLLIVLGGVFAAGLPSRIVPGGEAPASSQSEVVARALADSPLPSLFVTIRVAPGTTQLRQAQLTSSVAAAARRVKGVTDVSPMPDTRPAQPTGAQVTVLDIATNGGTDGAVKTAHTLSRTLAHVVPDSAAQVYVGGFGAYRDELTTDSQQSLERAERVGIPIVLVVLLLTFGSLWAAAIPLAIALTALVIGLGGIGAASYFLPMSDYVTNAASMIGLALGVDYAMFLVQRVRELTHSGHSVNDALHETMRTTGTAVLWSGITVLLAESTLLLVDSRSIRSAAFGMVMVTLFALGTALLVGPVLISLLGTRVAPARRHAAQTRAARGWQRWARHVTRHAPVWLIASVVVMVGLALPSIKLHSSVSISGTSSLPASSPVRQAYELAAERYGPAALSPVVVLLPSGHQGDATRAVQAVDSDPQVAALTSSTLPDGSQALIVTAKADPYSPAARDLVLRLRTGSLHAVLAGVPYWVGGETADSVDATQAIFDGLPKVGLALLVIIALVLLFALRSVFLPVKAVVLVVLSLGASLGSLLLLATTRLGAMLIGANGPQDIHPIVPITIVAITVALSTDYEVILISRIAEHYRRTGDNRGAVVSGVEHTGSVITSAAAIMIAVFAGFAQADLLPVKQLGVGLALAVFLDATVVRGVLVPAAMAVMGRGNWWWPGQRHALQRHSTVFPHAYCTCGADLGTVEMLAGSPQRDESRTDVTQTIVRERPGQELATTMREGGVSIRDEKQAVGAFDHHSKAARWADIEAAKMLASHLQQHESGPGRIHHAADLTQTVVVERPSWLPVP